MRTAVGLCAKNERNASDWRKGGYKRGTMSECGCCCKTGGEKQYVNHREQDQRGAAESGSRFHNKIIYTQNE